MPDLRRRRPALPARPGSAVAPVVAALTAALLVAAVAVPSAAGAATTTADTPAADAPAAATPDPAFCSAFGDYYDAAFLVQFVTAFAQSLQPKSVAKTRSTILFVLSPKLQKLLDQMAVSAAKPLRAAFRKQAAKFATGTKILRDAGLTEEQITTLANASLHPSDTSGDLTGQTHLSKKKLNAAITRFSKTGASVDPSVTFSASQRTRLGTDGVACGVFPDPTVSCNDLVSSADVAAAAGADATLQTSQGCWWKGGSSPDGNVFGLGVDVDRGTQAYDRLVAAGSGATPVAGVGDAATMLNGFTSFADFSSCGHTLVTKTGARTVTVALCPASGEATADRLATIARSVLAKL